MDKKESLKWEIASIYSSLFHPLMKQCTITTGRETVPELDATTTMPEIWYSVLRFATTRHLTHPCGKMQE